MMALYGGDIRNASVRRAEKLLAVKQWVTAAKEQAQDELANLGTEDHYDFKVYKNIEDNCTKALAALSDLEKL